VGPCEQLVGPQSGVAVSCAALSQAPAHCRASGVCDSFAGVVSADVIEDAGRRLADAAGSLVRVILFGSLAQAGSRLAMAGAAPGALPSSSAAPAAKKQPLEVHASHERYEVYLAAPIGGGEVGWTVVSTAASSGTFGSFLIPAPEPPIVNESWSGFGGGPQPPVSQGLVVTSSHVAAVSVNGSKVATACSNASSCWQISGRPSFVELPRSASRHPLRVARCESRRPGRRLAFRAWRARRSESRRPSSSPRLTCSTRGGRHGVAQAGATRAAPAVGRVVRAGHPRRARLGKTRSGAHWLSEDAVANPPATTL
jgi:hypothetical protein